MTVRQMRDELNKLVDVGRGEVPFYIGDFEATGVLWIKDNSTQVFQPEEANGFLVEYS
tara:strand:+ start:280 stop:453 length:174 start_codon:yes stop_codon:yes gene_type:complete